VHAHASHGPLPGNEISLGNTRLAKPIKIFLTGTSYLYGALLPGLSEVASCVPVSVPVPVRVRDACVLVCKKFWVCEAVPCEAVPPEVQ